MAYNSEDIASKILDRLNYLDQQEEFSSKKLQLMMYFMQKEFRKYTDTKLFDEACVITASGPVIESVSKKYGNVQHIDYIGYVIELTDNDEIVFNIAFDIYNDYSVKGLMNIYRDELSLHQDEKGSKMGNNIMKDNDDRLEAVGTLWPELSKGITYLIQGCTGDLTQKEALKKWDEWRINNDSI